MNVDEFFADRKVARAIFQAVESAVEALGPSTLCVTKSQVAFRRSGAFAWVWTPDRYLRGDKLAPLVLSLSFREQMPSPRWKEVVQTAPSRFMHHLELRSPSEIDDEVRWWLKTAWDAAA